LVHLQYSLENKEAELEKAVREHETRWEKEQAFWKARVGRAQRTLEGLRAEVAGHSPTLAEIKVRLADANRENDALEAELGAKKKAQEGVKKKLYREEEVMRLRAVADADWKRELNTEREIARQLAEADRQERDLESEEGRAATERAQLDEVARTIRETDAAKQTEIEDKRSQLAIVDTRVASLADALARFAELFPLKPQT
jgi:chromosome segregation ATPase